MILSEKISDFIPKALTQLRAEQTALIENFDRPGYQSVRSDELLLMIGECFDFIDLLNVDDHGGLTEREVSDLIDFFVKQLDLNSVVAANYLFYKMPISGSVIITTPGNYATAAALAAEILARIAADQALLDLINNLQDPGDILPDDFFDLHNADDKVVWNDDPRLHSHSNKTQLDQVDGIDIQNIKALTNHYQSLGEPGGQHVTQDDRNRWNANVGSQSIVKRQGFTADGSTSIFVITNGTVDQVNFVSVNGQVQKDSAYVVDQQNIIFPGNLPNLSYVQVSYFEGLALAGGGGGGDDIYDMSSPTTIPVGGMPAGTVLTGRTLKSILEEILVDYLQPFFSLFDVSDLPLIVEVGVNIGGVRNFVWTTTNPSNVQANSIAIRDVTANVLIATGLANDGAESVNVGAIANTSPITRAWRAEALNTMLAPFVSGNDIIMSLYPFFYGKAASGGAAPGASRPAANQALINSGTKVVQSSAGTISINFNSTSDDYIWFAIPASMASKLAWFVSTLNNGPIGGAVGAGGNLFPDPATVSIDSPTALWTGVNYKIYIANYQSAVALLMELRNS